MKKKQVETAKTKEPKKSVPSSAKKKNSALQKRTRLWYWQFWQLHLQFWPYYLHSFCQPLYSLLPCCWDALASSADLVP